MTVSVIQRIREMGTCMAVEAKRRDIPCQFLIKALCITIPGGISGVITGVSIAFAV